MSELAKRLRHLCSPDAERMSDYQRINSMVITGHEAADRIDALETALQGIIKMCDVRIHRLSLFDEIQHHARAALAVTE